MSRVARSSASSSSRENSSRRCLSTRMPCALHVGEDGDERPLDVLVELEEPDFSERPWGHRPQLPDPSRAAARRGQAGSLAEQLAGDFLQPVVGLRRIEQIGDEGGVLHRRRRAAATEPPLDQVLGVMSDQRPPAEVGQRVAPRGPGAVHEGGGARRRMKEAERRRRRIGRAAVARPLDGDRVTRGNLREIDGERLGAGEHRRRLGGDRSRGRGRKLAQQAGELELGPERAQLVPVRLLTAQALEVAGRGARACSPSPARARAAPGSDGWRAPRAACPAPGAGSGTAARRCRTGR